MAKPKKQRHVGSWRSQSVNGRLRGIALETNDNIVWEEKRVWDPFEQVPLIVPHSNGFDCFHCGAPSYLIYCRLEGERAGIFRRPPRVLYVCGSGTVCEEKAIKSCGWSYCGWCRKLECRESECRWELSKSTALG